MAVLHVITFAWESACQGYFQAFKSITRVKTHKLLQVCKQVVTSLFTSCQQVVFALLVPGLL